MPDQALPAIHAVELTEDQEIVADDPLVSVDGDTENELTEGVVLPTPPPEESLSIFISDTSWGSTPFQFISELVTGPTRTAYAMPPSTMVSSTPVTTTV